MKLIHRWHARRRPWSGIRVELTLNEVMEDLVGARRPSETRDEG